MDIQKQQLAVCAQHKVDFAPSPDKLKVGISRNFDPVGFPINGLRHPPQGDTTGWYIWSGEEFSQEPGFFVPLHVKHLPERCPELMKFLGLPPGWRFLVAPGYEDVWKDAALLNS